MHVQIVLFDGFYLLDALAPYEVFHAASLYTNKAITVELVTAEGERTVTSGVNHVKLQASSNLDVSRSGIILLPGAAGSLENYGSESIPNKLKQACETDLKRLLHQAMNAPHILLATVCGGSLILAMAGLLEDRHAVTHHMGMELLGATGSIPINARIVDDGDLVSSGGVTSGIDVALYLVERELGPRIAHAVEQLFEHERRGTVWTSEGLIPEPHQTTSEEEATVPFQSHDLKNGTYQGQWDAIISTPIGNLSVLFDLTNKDGQLTGTAKQKDEIVPLDNLAIIGNQLTWSMKVTKPLRLSLKFCVTINENQMIGEAKAGMLPASKLVAHRIS